MNIKFITFSPEAPASKFYFDALSLSDNFTISTNEDFSNIDYVFFMSYADDLKELKKFKRKYSKIKTAIIDPRNKKVDTYIKYCDFLIVDSIEMKDYFSKFAIPIFTYIEYPFFIKSPKKHKEKDLLVIGYHGNKVHLTAMYPKITSALKYLSMENKIEFWAIYDIKGLGRWNIGIPDGLKVRHIQWHPNVYTEELTQIDIGVVPSTLPVKKNIKNVSKFFLDSEEDYIIKFKMPSNPGRLAVFAKLGIPVVADFLPSHFQFIKNGYSGFIADSSGAWYKALKSLTESTNLRNSLAENMFKTYEESFDFEKQNNNLFSWLKQLSGDNLSSSKKQVEYAERTDFHSNIKFNNAFFYDSLFKLARKIKIFFDY